MRIEQSTAVYQTGARSQKKDLSQSSAFQQLMNAKRQDGFIARADTLSATGISAKDSTEVKLAKLANIAEQSDYTGMSYDEIYATIWNRYNEAFDGNMTAITGGVGGPESWDHVNNQFVTEIGKNISNPIRRELYRSSGVREWNPELQKQLSASTGEIRLKAMGYEGMSFAEIESAIAKKYEGKNSTLDYLNMQGELDVTGCLSNRMGESAASSYVGMIAHRFEVAYNPQSRNRPEDGGHPMTDEQWQRVANEPFDSKAFAGEMKDMLAGMTFDGFPSNYREMIADLIERYAEKFKDITGEL